MSVYTISDCGRERTSNEDNSINYFNTNFSLLLVADGMGGHLAGEIASKMACEACQAYIVEHKNRDDYASLLRESIEYANDLIYKKSQEDPNCSGMGTTIVSCIVADNKVYIANVGDSRLYIYSDELKLITKDHSIIFNLVEEGVISLDEARFHPGKNAITRAVGTEDKINVDLFEKDIKEGDYILLCTDGLTNLVSENEMIDVLESESDVKDMCENLVYIANENGGHDNITVTIFRNRS